MTGRGQTLESELGSRPRGFESRILRQAAIVSFGSGRQDAAALARHTVRAFLFDVLQTLRAQASARGYDRGVTGPEPLPDYVLRNRAYWDEVNAQRFAEPGRHAWASDEFTWGIFHMAESDLRALPDDLAGRDVIELGCGTAYISAWLARRGARVTGIDNSEEQLKTARALQADHDLEFPLLHGNAESVPLPNASFDLAISEYGASIWADPYRWIPEASRLLRPEGELVFLVNGTLWVLTVPETDDEGPAADRLLRPYFGMHRFEWPNESGVEFHLGYGDWIRLLRANGFEVLDLIEVRAPEGAHSPEDLVDPGWARRYPAEQIWRAKKRSAR
jgi:SAM-dependent methyltransferase